MKRSHPNRPTLQQEVIAKFTAHLLLYVQMHDVCIHSQTCHCMYTTVMLPTLSYAAQHLINPLTQAAGYTLSVCWANKEHVATHRGTMASTSGQYSMNSKLTRKAMEPVHCCKHLHMEWCFEHTYPHNTAHTYVISMPGYYCSPPHTHIICCAKL